MEAYSHDFLRLLGQGWRTCVRMVQDRGWTPPPSLLPLLQLSLDDLAWHFVEEAAVADVAISEAMSFETGERHRIVFLDRQFDTAKARDRMVSSEQIKALVRTGKMAAAAHGRTVLISPGKLSPDAKKEAAKLPRCQVILLQDLLLNVTHHKLVHRHILLTEAEKAAFAAHRRLDPAQLPLLKQSDPVAAYFGYEPGDVVRIERPQCPFYRVVVAG